MKCKKRGAPFCFNEADGNDRNLVTTQMYEQIYLRHGIGQ